MLKRDEKGRFIKGNKSGKRYKKRHKPWNKGLIGIHLNEKTEFVEGQNVGKDHPSWKGGVQYLKEGVYLWDGVNKRKKRSRAIYEETYGDIPIGYVIYHIDGNRYNDDPKNLIAISRSQLLEYNRM